MRKQTAAQNLTAEQVREWIRDDVQVNSEFYDAYHGSRSELIRAELVAPDFAFPGDPGGNKTSRRIRLSDGRDLTIRRVDADYFALSIDTDRLEYAKRCLKQAQEQPTTAAEFRAKLRRDFLDRMSLFLRQATRPDKHYWRGNGGFAISSDSIRRIWANVQDLADTVANLEPVFHPEAREEIFRDVQKKLERASGKPAAEFKHFMVAATRSDANSPAD
jgi:hypothetical protein